jgi:hypothetical protein
MPRKRIKSKQKLIINHKRLTNELYESICKKVSMSELLGDYKHLGYKYGYYFKIFNASNLEACKEIWNLHKDEVMNRWKLDKNNAGKRPFLWWIVEAPEPKRKVKQIRRYYKYPNGKIIYTALGDLKEEVIEEETDKEYLRRLDLLEDWEIKEFEANY